MKEDKIKEYKIIIDSVIQEFIPNIVKEHLENIKYNPNREEMIRTLEPKLDEIYLEYRFIRFNQIVDRIHVLSGFDKETIVKDYNEIKNDHEMFNFKIRNEIIFYLKRKE